MTLLDKAFEGVIGEIDAINQGFVPITTHYTKDEWSMLESAIQSLANSGRKFRLVIVNSGHEIWIPQGEKLVAPDRKKK